MVVVLSFSSVLSSHSYLAVIRMVVRMVVVRMVVVRSHTSQSYAWY